MYTSQCENNKHWVGVKGGGGGVLEYSVGLGSAKQVKKLVSWGTSIRILRV